MVTNPSPGNHHSPRSIQPGYRLRYRPALQWKAAHRRNSARPAWSAASPSPSPMAGSRRTGRVGSMNGCSSSASLRASDSAASSGIGARHLAAHFGALPRVVDHHAPTTTAPAPINPSVNSSMHSPSYFLVALSARLAALLKGIRRSFERLLSLTLCDLRPTRYWIFIRYRVGHSAPARQNRPPGPGSPYYLDARSKKARSNVQAFWAKPAADSISTATIRETPCSCIVTPISCCAISIAILLCEMKRNCVFSDIARTRFAKRSVLASSSGASTSSQQTERRRIQLEHRKHERRGGECLFAARQQVNGRILLARRLREHLHAGIEDFVAGHHEFRLAAAEKDAGKSSPK